MMRAFVEMILDDARKTIASHPGANAAVVSVTEEMIDRAGGIETMQRLAVEAGMRIAQGNYCPVRRTRQLKIRVAKPGDWSDS